MTNETVPSAEQPDHFAELAAELHKVADDIATLVGSGLPKPGQFQLNIQPGGRNNGDLTARAVDAMARVLIGIDGDVREMGSGTYHYGTDHLRRGPLEVVVYQGVPTEWALRNDVAAAKAALAKREAELEKARAVVAKLEQAHGPLVSDESGLGYSREADDPTPVSPARVPLHTGSVVEGDELIVDGQQ